MIILIQCQANVVVVNLLIEPCQCILRQPALKRSFSVCFEHYQTSSVINDYPIFHYREFYRFIPGSKWVGIKGLRHKFEFDWCLIKKILLDYVCMEFCIIVNILWLSCLRVSYIFIWHIWETLKKDQIFVNSNSRMLSMILEEI